MVVLKPCPCLTEKAKWVGTTAISEVAMSGEARAFGYFAFLLEMIILSILNYRKKLS